MSRRLGATSNEHARGPATFRVSSAHLLECLEDFSQIEIDSESLHSRETLTSITLLNANMHVASLRRHILHQNLTAVVVVERVCDRHRT